MWRAGQNETATAVRWDFFFVHREKVARSVRFASIYSVTNDARVRTVVAVVKCVIGRRDRVSIIVEIIDDKFAWARYVGI